MGNAVALSARLTFQFSPSPSVLSTWLRKFHRFSKNIKKSSHFFAALSFVKAKNSLPSRTGGRFRLLLSQTFLHSPCYIRVSAHCVLQQAFVAHRVLTWAIILSSLVLFIICIGHQIRALFFGFRALDLSSEIVVRQYEIGTTSLMMSTVVLSVPAATISFDGLGFPQIKHAHISFFVDTSSIWSRIRCPCSRPLRVSSSTYCAKWASSSACRS